MDSSAEHTFVYEITDGLQLHDMVQLKGLASSGGRQIVVELSGLNGLLDGKMVEHSKRTEIPFRCVVSFDGSWELFGRFAESRVHLFGHADYTVEQGSEFSFQIVAYKSRFVMYHNEEELFALNYLVPLSSISHLALSGDASFTDIEFMESYDFLKLHHPDMFEHVFGAAEIRSPNTGNDTDNFDGIVHPIRVTPHVDAEMSVKDSTIDPLTRNSGNNKLPDYDKAERLKKAVDTMESVRAKDEGTRFGDSSLKKAAETNLFEKLISSGLIHLQLIETGSCERSPVPIRIGREIRVAGRLLENSEKFYVSVSTVSNKHVAKLLQGEVTLFMSIQLQPSPVFSAYLLHGPVYSELMKSVKLPAKLRPGETFEISVQFLHKFIAVNVNGGKCLNYNYALFEQADRNLRFPLAQLHYLSIWGDVVKSAVKFDYPVSLILPHYNALIEKLEEYDQPEIRIQTILHEKTEKITVVLQQGDCEEVQSPMIIRCIIDSEHSAVLFETERYGNLNDSKSVITESLRSLHGPHDFVVQLDHSKETIQLWWNKNLIGAYNQKIGSLSSLSHIKIEGDFILKNIEYFPTNKKGASPCCECVLL